MIEKNQIKYFHKQLIMSTSLENLKNLVDGLLEEQERKTAALQKLITEQEKLYHKQERELQDMFTGQVQERNSARRAWAAEQVPLTPESTFEDIFVRMEKEFVASEGISPIEAPSDILAGLELFAKPENLKEFRTAFYEGQKKLYAELFQKFLTNKTGKIASALNAGEEWF